MGFQSEQRPGPAGRVRLGGKRGRAAGSGRKTAGMSLPRGLFLFFPVWLLFLSCAANPVWNSSREITVMTYNVHNLFDAVSDGGEYPEYDPAEGEWTEKDYENRLANTADVIRGAVRGGPDVVLCQELEHLSDRKSTRLNSSHRT